MSRLIKIVSITPSSGPTKASIQLAADLTQVFQGKFYMNSSGARLPFYTDPAPVGYDVVIATDFDIVQNDKYNGHYTVYTPLNSVDTPSSVFDSVNTTVTVTQTVPPLLSGDAPTLLTDGYVTNVSTYVLTYEGGQVIVPPGTTNTTDTALKLFGKYSIGFGEALLQNLVSMLANFAGGTSPSSPFQGMTWFDTVTQVLKVWNGSSWIAAGSPTYNHNQAVAASTWTINHGMDLPAPYIAGIDFYVDTGGGAPKLILPADVSFIDANTISATFSNPETGFAIVRR